MRPAAKRSSSGSLVVWGTIVTLAAVVVLSVWRLKDSEQHDRRSLLAYGDPLDKLAGATVGLKQSLPQQGSSAEYLKLSTELNVTRQELLASQQKTQELEAENSRVRRGMDDVLTELHKLFLNKTNGDTNALVEAEALRGELITAQERADLAEQRTKIAAGLMAACEQRIQANGSVQAAFDSLTTQLAGFKQTQQKLQQPLASGVNGTVQTSALQSTGGAGAATAILQASEAEQTQQGKAAAAAQPQLTGLQQGSTGAAQAAAGSTTATGAGATVGQTEAQGTVQGGTALMGLLKEQAAQAAGGAAAAGAGQGAASTTGPQRQDGAALETGPGLEKV